MKKLSIIIPVYNEEATIRLILDKIKSVNLLQQLQKEIILINDGSFDQSEIVIKNYLKQEPELNIQYYKNRLNQGKGAAVKLGIQKATGDLLIIQDADLECDPSEYNILLKPILDGIADVVYGSRFKNVKTKHLNNFWNSNGNKVLTFISNRFTKFKVTDMETCYKLFKIELIKNINLCENRFGFEPEITAKISKIPDLRLCEVPISYFPRTKGEGKKMSVIDGFRAVYCIIKYNVFSK